jgi:hypothetical protein
VKTKRVWSLLIVGLLALSVLVVFTGAVAGLEQDPFKIEGIIRGADGNPVGGCDVTIQKQHSLVDGVPEEKWDPLVGLALPGTLVQMTTDSAGYYCTGWCLVLDYTGGGYGDPVDNYKMYLDGVPVDEREITFDMWDDTNTIFWKYQWNHQIPEFATIAMPVASILGLLFFFNHRKRRKE